MKKFGFVVLLAATSLTGCTSIRRTLGLDRHKPEDVSVPVAKSIVRQLPPEPGEVRFAPDHIAGAPNTVRVFVKNGDWLTASPGAWYEIPWTVVADTRTVEYVVIDFTAQTAVVRNQPAFTPRAIVVESVPPGAFDPGIPAQSFDGSFVDFTPARREGL